MPFRTSLPLLGLLSLVTAGMQAQTSPVPGPIRQRLGQALWPEVLFDSSGHPQPGYSVRGFRGDPATDLDVEAVSPDSFPWGLQVYRGSAFRCFDCDLSLAAVVTQGAQLATLVVPEDLEVVLTWVLPPSQADSAAVRQATLSLLASTCLLGCGVAEFRSKRQLSSFVAALCRGPAGETDWQLPKALVYPNGSFTAYAFNVRAGTQVYRVTVAWSSRNYLVRSTLLADCTLRP